MRQVYARGSGKSRRDGSGKILEAIDHGDQNITDILGFEFVHDS